MDINNHEQQINQLSGNEKFNYIISLSDESTRIDIKELLKVGKISSQSYSDATDRICRHGNFKDQYKFYYADSSTNEIAYTDKSNYKICVLDYDYFIQKFKYYIYENKIDMKENQALLDYIQKKFNKI